VCRRWLEIAAESTEPLYGGVFAHTTSERRRRRLARRRERRREVFSIAEYLVRERRVFDRTDVTERFTRLYPTTLLGPHFRESRSMPTRCARRARAWSCA